MRRVSSTMHLGRYRPNRDSMAQLTLSKAVKGATKPKQAPPKSKYVQYIQDTLCQQKQDEDLEHFFDLLQARLAHGIDYDTTQTRNSNSSSGAPPTPPPEMTIIALKAHILFHTHVLSDNNYKLPKYQLWNYISVYSENTDTFLLPQHHCRYTTAAANRLASCYNRYLNQRLADFDQLKLDPVREKRDQTSVVDNTQPVVINLAPSSTNLLDQATRVIVQVRLILDCIFTPELIESDALYSCLYNLLATDLATLFNFLNLTIVHALQNFFSLARPDAERTLFLYKEYTQLQIIEEVENFLALGPNMSNPDELQVPSALQQNHQSIQQLTKALESYLFTRDEPSSEDQQQHHHHHHHHQEPQKQNYDQLQYQPLPAPRVEAAPTSRSYHTRNMSSVTKIYKDHTRQSSSVYSTEDDTGAQTPTHYEYDACKSATINSAASSMSSLETATRVEKNPKRNITSYTHSSVAESLTSDTTTNSTCSSSSPITPSTGDDINEGLEIWNEIFGSLDSAPAESFELNTTVLKPKFTPLPLDKPLPEPPSASHGEKLQAKTKSFIKALRKPGAKQEV